MDTWENEARQALLKRRSSLRRQLERGAGAAGPVRTESLSEEDVRELQSIDEALVRLESGSFGWSARCGGAIGLHRMRAVPEARHCWVCSELVRR